MWKFKRKKTVQAPDWVDQLPFDGDRQTIWAMIQAGANLNEPREIVFCVYATQKAAAKLQKDAEQFGWECLVKESANQVDSDTDYLLEIKQTGYMLDLKNFLEDKTTIQSLAKRHEAEYDGWYASI